MRTAQPVDAWTAYFAILTEALSASPANRAVRREAPPQARDLPDAPPAADLAPRRGLIERLDHWFWRQRQAACERHLAQSLDIHDLEARMREFERPGSTLF